MIIMNLELDNIYGFKNFKMNFAYPKKIVGSTIENEHLPLRPNFRYKKVNIIMGGNASGKTTLGKAIRDIFYSIALKQFDGLGNAISDKNKVGKFSADIVLVENVMHRFIGEIFPDNKKVIIQVQKAYIAKNDSYEKCCKKLEETTKEIGNERITKIGWNFALSEGSEFILINNTDDGLKLAVLEKVLQALDTDIISVKKLDVKDSYVIKKENQEIIIQEGEVIKESKLSSGTVAGIRIADLISSIILRENGFYYCDEKFSYVHSDLEQAFLSVMINKLGGGEQLFFTSHNMDLLDMNLPRHSFSFLRKREKIEVVYPSEFIKKNDISLRNAMENDVFDVIPSRDKIYELEDLEVENK